MSIRANLSGKPLLCAAAAARALAQRGYPIPQEFARANSFLCPRGRQPGRGWLVMRRKDAEALDKAVTHTLTFRDGDRTLELKGLVYVTSRCLTVGAVNRDPDGAHLAEVADERWLAANPLYQHGLTKSYNVVAPDYRAATDADRWITTTINGAAPWTWRTLLADLWGRLPAAAVAAPCPDLALVPDLGEPYVPHNWRFVGEPVWDALNDVLEHLSLALALDPTKALNAAGRFRVVDPGSADGALDALHKKAAAGGWMLYDNAAVDNPEARLPAWVRVEFPAPPRHHGGERATGDDGGQWPASPAYANRYANPYANGQAGVVHTLWSDFEVHTLANGTRLDGDTYGCTLKADVWGQWLSDGWFRTLHAGGVPLLQRIYLGAWPFLPGSMLSGVAWRQGDWKGQPSLLTEVVRGPGQAVRVGDEGRFEGLAPNRPAQAPALGWGFPAYPPHLQILGPATGTGISVGLVTGTGVGVDDMAVYQYDAQAGALLKRESIWAKALPDGYVQGRIVGYEDGRPVYVTGMGEPCPCGQSRGAVLEVVTAICVRQS